MSILSATSFIIPTRAMRSIGHEYFNIAFIRSLSNPNFSFESCGVNNIMFKRLAKIFDISTHMSSEVCSPKIISAIYIAFSGMMTINNMLKNMFVVTLRIFIRLKRLALFSFLSIAKGTAAIASKATIIPIRRT